MQTKEQTEGRKEGKQGEREGWRGGGEKGRREEGRKIKDCSGGSSRLSWGIQAQEQS